MRARRRDRRRARRGRQAAAETELKKPAVAPEDFERARIALIKALTRLQVASKARTRG